MNNDELNALIRRSIETVHFQSRSPASRPEQIVQGLGWLQEVLKRLSGSILLVACVLVALLILYFVFRGACRAVDGINHLFG